MMQMANWAHMRAVLHFLLLFSLLFGLAAEGAALAAEPCPMEHAQSSAMAGMDDCCPEDGPANHDGSPCEEITLACLAMTGCATMGALESEKIGSSIPSGHGAPLFWMLEPSLHGRTIPPDTHPPARLS